MRTKPTRHNGLSIRHFRIKDGVKPGAFAAAAGIAYSTLDNIENERKEASVETLHRIAKLLDVPVGALLRDPNAVAGEQPQDAVA